MSNLNKGTPEYLKYKDCCNFIIEEMNFYSFDDFITYHKRIKLLFDNANDLIVQLYMWYVYSRYISKDQKYKIWAFLNNDMTYEELIDQNLTKK